LYGEDGSDTLIGGKGADALDGGIGFDGVSYVGSTAGVIVDLTLAKGQRGDAQGDAYVSIESVEGSASDDQVIGNGETNRFIASWGNDTYEGRGGADLYASVSANWSVEIAFGSRAQELASLLGATLPTPGYGIAVKTSADAGTLAGGPAYDLLLDLNNFQGGSRNDTIAGNDANNTIFASFGTDVLSGGDGFDYIVANGSNVIDLQAGTLTGSATTATLTGFEAAFGSTAVDTLLGNADANRLEGRGDNDNLAGRGGNDHLLGGDGNDLMRGEAGNDIMEGGRGGDLLDGGQGIDWASYLESDTEVQVDLLLGRGSGVSLDSSGDRYINVENVVGSKQDDTIGGNNSDNILVGDKGSDDISGCGGDDVIYGDVYPVLLGLLPESEYLSADGAINPICGCINEDDGEGDGDTFTIANMIDDLQGGDGDDRLFGQGGTDLLRGDRGDDFLSGGNQLDLLFGGDDDDTLDGGGGADFLFGGNGFDIASYATSQAAVSVDLTKPFPESAATRKAT
jgi:Ca2+-binding RTX toxin-like protein